MTTAARTTVLSPRELAAWRAFLRAHAHLTKQLETELQADADLPLASYDVLVQLSEAPGRRLRMTDLADRVLLSRSGLTRLVDRLERTGLVARAKCPNDARGTFTVLTEAGYERLRQAAPAHLDGVREHMTRHLEPAELDVLTDLLTKLLQRDGGDT
ncbi:MAG: MarR family transcriptional regulator [Mycobacteriales bacterium]